MWHLSSIVRKQYYLMVDYLVNSSYFLASPIIGNTVWAAQKSVMLSWSTWFRTGTWFPYQYSSALAMSVYSYTIKAGPKRDPGRKTIMKIADLSWGPSESTASTLSTSFSKAPTFVDGIVHIKITTALPYHYGGIIRIWPTVSSGYRETPLRGSPCWSPSLWWPQSWSWERMRMKRRWHCRRSRRCSHLIATCRSCRPTFVN